MHSSRWCFPLPSFSFDIRSLMQIKFTPVNILIIKNFTPLFVHDNCNQYIVLYLHLIALFPSFYCLQTLNILILCVCSEFMNTDHTTWRVISHLGCIIISDSFKPKRVNEECQCPLTVLRWRYCLDFLEVSTPLNTEYTFQVCIFFSSC